MSTPTDNRPAADTKPPQPPQPRTGGVSDYFAILGVGETLVLKSTQKTVPIVDEAAPPPPPPPPPAGGGGGDDGRADEQAVSQQEAAVDSASSMPDKYGTEEECAWMERFYREIVEVAVVVTDCGGEGDGSGSGDHGGERRHLPQQSDGGGEAGERRQQLEASSSHAGGTGPAGEESLSTSSAIGGGPSLSSPSRRRRQQQQRPLSPTSPTRRRGAGDDDDLDLDDYDGGIASAARANARARAAALAAAAAEAEAAVSPVTSEATSGVLSLEGGAYSLPAPPLGSRRGGTGTAREDRPERVGGGGGAGIGEGGGAAARPSHAAAVADGFDVVWDTPRVRYPPSAASTAAGGGVGVAPAAAAAAGVPSASPHDADLDPTYGLRSALLSSAAPRGGGGGDGDGDGSQQQRPEEPKKKMLNKIGRKVGDAVRSNKLVGPILSKGSGEWLQSSSTANASAGNIGVDGASGHSSWGAGSRAASPRGVLGAYGTGSEYEYDRPRKRYHLAYRRRGPDESDRPAVAEVAVWYVRLSRLSTTVVASSDARRIRGRDGVDVSGDGERHPSPSSGSAPDCAAAATDDVSSPQRRRQQPQQPLRGSLSSATLKQTLTTGANLAADAARVAYATGATRLMEARKGGAGGAAGPSEQPQQQRARSPRLSRRHFFPDTEEKAPRGGGGSSTGSTGEADGRTEAAGPSHRPDLCSTRYRVETVRLEEALRPNLPDGYDEWSVPEPYRFLRLPVPVPDGAAGEDDERRRLEREGQEEQERSDSRRRRMIQRTYLFQHEDSDAVLGGDGDGGGVGGAAASGRESPDEPSGVGVEALYRGSSRSASPNLSSPSSLGQQLPSPASETLGDRYAVRPKALLEGGLDHGGFRHRGGGEGAGDLVDPILLDPRAHVPLLLSPSSLPPPDETEVGYDYVPLLAVRRQRVGDEERYHEDPAAVDLAVTFRDGAGVPVMPANDGDGAGDYYDEDENDDDEEEAGGAVSLLRKTGWAAPPSVVASAAAATTAAGGASDRSSPRVSPERRYSTPPNLLGIPVILLRHNTPRGFADAAFATRVLDRFPEQDYSGLPMPMEELPMFCYPTGCRLHRARFQDAPLAQCYGFVVKNERGDSIHVSCVSFMEPLTRDKIEQLNKMSELRRRTSIPHRLFCQKRMGGRYRNDRRGPHGRRHQQLRTTGSSVSDLRSLDESVEGGADGSSSVVESDYLATFEGDSVCDRNGVTVNDDDDFLLTGFDSMTTFENKTLCLISRYPFWTAFRRFLSHLHVMSGSSSDLPLERSISHLLLTVPVPKPGGQSVIVPLPALNGPMVLTMPPAKDFPLLDLPFQRLFACLDVPTVVTVVLGFLALERKVIVMSTHPSLVLDACELLRSLLFPFELCAPYVPRLTQPFMSCLDFPGAIFVGIHDDECKDGLAAVVRKSIPEDSVIIDLDTGDIDCSGDRYEVLKQCWNIIPAEQRTILVQEIETLCRDAGLVPGQEPIDSQLDSAFDASVPTTTTLVEDFDDRGHRAKEPLDDRAIRDCFLRFFCSILGGYERYLVVPDMDFLISGNEWFDAQGFLASSSQDHAPFLGSLVSTQLFQSFIQRRTEASDVHCMLFDDCLAEFHSSTIPYGRLGGDVETVTAVEGGDQQQVLFSLLVDQCATELPQDTHDTSIVDSHSVRGDGDRTKSGTMSADGSDAETYISTGLGGMAIHPSGSHSVDASVLSTTQTDNSFCILNNSGDLVTAPSRHRLPENYRFMYCIDGNPCFPHKLKRDLFFPMEPESLSAELAEVVVPVLTRSDRELDEANRRRKLATSQRGLHNQRRCLWQLPKLMGSHFLGAWLMCTPPQVSQQGLSAELQARYLLRALGALRLLRSKQRIIPDEAAYRCLMVACGRADSDRRVELVKLFGLLRSDGIFPSSITLGQYTRGIAEGFSKRSSGTPDENLADSGTSKDGSNNPAKADAASMLTLLDANLSNLEESGRRWRHRQNRDALPNNRTRQDIHAASTSNGAETKGRPRKNSHKSWLPVNCSTSFSPMSRGCSFAKESFEFVALWSRATVCKSCSYVPLDEEIMSGWDVNQNDTEESCDVSCPRCGSLFTPLLGYRRMALDEALQKDFGGRESSKGKKPAEVSPPCSSVTSFDTTSTHEINIAEASAHNEKDPLPPTIQTCSSKDFLDIPSQLRPFLGKNASPENISQEDIHCGTVGFVPYLSPSDIRLLLERYVEEQGEDILEREALRKLDPRLFYNLWWFCARFSLPLPLMVSQSSSGNETADSLSVVAERQQDQAIHLFAFSAWDKSVAEKGCEAGAKAVVSLLKSYSLRTELNGLGSESQGQQKETLPSPYPLLSQFNFQTYAQADWDHPDLSEILVSLVEACDKRDFLPVVDCVLRRNRIRRGKFGKPSDASGSDAVGSDTTEDVVVDLASDVPAELDCYRTLLYLARYQCTTAFHVFFPATAKACKGYHFWCATVPLPLFDRFFRDAIKQLRGKDGTFTPVHDVSDVALGFRCVFGHLI